MTGSKHTRPEICVRKALFECGLRFRLHCRALPGTPDIVIRKAKLAIFVHGCFWHGHECNLNGHSDKLSKQWRRKIEAQKLRDAENAKALTAIGWAPMVLWECEIKEDINSAIELVVWIANKQT